LKANGGTFTIGIPKPAADTNAQTDLAPATQQDGEVPVARTGEGEGRGQNG